MLSNRSGSVRWSGCPSQNPSFYALDDEWTGDLCSFGYECFAHAGVSVSAAHLGGDAAMSRKKNGPGVTTIVRMAVTSISTIGTR
jgi:hypothetical protein